jgi:DNA-binding MarR family transcriptional regulator
MTARGATGAQGRNDVTTAVNSFRRLLRELRVAARHTEEATGLSAAQLFVLSAVAESSGCSINDVAEATMTDRSSAAAIVDRLVSSGYLSREKSDDDRRRASIVLTARGRGATRRAAPAPTTLLVRGLSRLRPNQLRDLTRGLLSLTRAMGIAEEPPHMLFEDGHGRRTRAAPRSSP